MPKRYSRRNYGRGERVDLEKDFPQIADITGVVEITPSVGGERRIVRNFTKTNLPVQYIACENPVCENGGIPLGDLFRDKLVEMVRNGQTDGEVNEWCEGTMDMGRGQRRVCRTTHAHIKIQIEYGE